MPARRHSIGVKLHAGRAKRQREGAGSLEQARYTSCDAMNGPECWPLSQRAATVGRCRKQS